MFIVSNLNFTWFFNVLNQSYFPKRHVAQKSRLVQGFHACPWALGNRPSIHSKALADFLSEFLVV